MDWKEYPRSTFEYTWQKNNCLLKNVKQNKKADIQKVC